MSLWRVGRLNMVVVAVQYISIGRESTARETQLCYSRVMQVRKNSSYEGYGRWAAAR